MAQRRRTREQLRAFFAKLGNRVRTLFPKQKEEKEGKSDEQLFQHFKDISKSRQTPDQVAFAKYKDRILQRNQGLVYSIAKKYNKKGHSLSLDDLVQEGNLGMMTAIDKFDPKKGTQFSTYAVPWIRQAIGRAIEETGENIRVASNVQWNRNNLNKVDRSFQAQFNRPPTDAELIKITGLSKSQIKAARESATGRTSQFRDLYNEEGEASGSTMDLIPDSSTPSPYDMVNERQSRDTDTSLMLSAFKNTKLTPMEKKIIFEKYGPLASPDTENVHIARSLGLSRARVTQLEQSAINKLRGDKAGRLRKYLDKSKSKTRKQKNG